MWLLDDRFREEVLNNLPKKSSYIQNSLHVLRESLIEWNQDFFGNVYWKKRRLLGQLKSMHNYLQSHPMSRFNQDLESELQDDLLRT